MEDGVHDFGGFGLGRGRTLADYQRYAGVDFAKRWVSPEALGGVPPRWPLAS